MLAAVGKQSCGLQAVGSDSPLCSCLVCVVQGLWMGTVPGMLLTIPYTAVQFVALQQCKDTAAKLGWEGEARPARCVAHTYQSSRGVTHV